MAVIGREAARAPLTSADINDGIVTDADLAPTLDLSSKSVTLPTIATADINGGTIDGAALGSSSAITALTVSGNVSVDGGTIKLDGNYPVGTDNVALGDAALDDGSLSGTVNTAIGSNALSANTSGAGGAALGYNALTANTTGNWNVGVGVSALAANTTGSNNIGIGQSALQANTTASNNTAVGYQALFANTSGTRNCAFGYGAADATTTALDVSAFGHNALGANTTGGQNAAFGTNALVSVTTGSGNTAIGNFALEACTGASNTAVGRDAGYLITTGEKNTILGRFNGNQGGLDIRTSSNYIVLSDGDGNPRFVVDNSGHILFGNAVSNGASGVGYSIVNSSGQPYVVSNTSSATRIHYYFQYNGSTVGTISTTTTATAYNTSSDYRLKEDWQPMSGATERLKQLKPVNFAWKVDGSRVDGFLAHEAAEVVPECVSGEKDAVDDEGNPIYQGIDQSKLVPLLVATIKELEARIAALEAN